MSWKKVKVLIFKKKLHSLLNCHQHCLFHLIIFEEWELYIHSFYNNQIITLSIQILIFGNPLWKSIILIIKLIVIILCIKQSLLLLIIPLLIAKAPSTNYTKNDGAIHFNDSNQHLHPKNLTQPIHTLISQTTWHRVLLFNKL